MDVSQRDVVYLVDKFNKETQEHPYIVLSCKDAILHEGLFTAIMLTNAKYDDLYSFRLSNSMFTRPLSSEGQARLHIIASFRTVQVTKSPVSKMKLLDFKRLLKQINDTIFSIDED